MVGEDFHRCAASRTQTDHVALEVKHGLDGNTAAVAGKADGLHRDGRERRDTRGIHAVGGGKGYVGLLAGTHSSSAYSFRRFLRGRAARKDLR